MPLGKFMRAEKRNDLCNIKMKSDNNTMYIQHIKAHKDMCQTNIKHLIW